MGEWENDMGEAGMNAEPDAVDLSDEEEQVLDMDMMDAENAENPALNGNETFDSLMTPFSPAATAIPPSWDSSPKIDELQEHVAQDFAHSHEGTGLEPGNLESNTSLDEENHKRDEEQISGDNIQKESEANAVIKPALDVPGDEGEDRLLTPNRDQAVPISGSEDHATHSAVSPHQQVVLSPSPTPPTPPTPPTAPAPPSAYLADLSPQAETNKGFGDTEVDQLRQDAQSRPHKRKLGFVDFTKYQTEPRRRKLLQDIKVIRSKEEWKQLQEKFKENNRVRWKNPEFGKAASTLIRMCEFNGVRSFEVYAYLMDQILGYMKTHLASDPDGLKRRAERKPEVVSMVEEMVRMCFPLIKESDVSFVDCALELMENLDRNGLLSEKLIQELAELGKGDKLFVNHREVSFVNRYYSYDVQTFAKRFESQVESLIYHSEFSRARGLCYDEDTFFGFDSEIECSILLEITDRFNKAPTQFREQMFKYLVKAFDKYEDVVYCTLLTIVLCDLNPKLVEESDLTSSQRVSMYLFAGFHSVIKPSLEELGRFREDVMHGIVGPDPLSMEGQCTLVVMSSIQGIGFLSKWFIQLIQNHSSSGSSEKKELEEFKNSDAYLGLFTLNLLSFYAYDILHGDARDVGIEEFITQKKVKHEPNMNLLVDMIIWDEGYQSSVQGTKSTVFSDQHAEDMRAAAEEDLFFRRFIVTYADMRLLEGEYAQFIVLQPAMDKIHLQFGETKMDNNNSRGQWRDASLNKFLISFSLYDPDTFKSIQTRMHECRASAQK
eukprot:CAMPEP_0184698520 /NCGR_PEP_ID=MMETSP0313-20130426/5126_1 /TAXON_ID=2792 /ORGANISM="Porphyridium aerugineum, Strain SAG 1380-2" /LENGTH=775 /DNA_ID=CAMNT_0027157483 /DNA_START=91 /DNA_END=2418 /DNA_ORIENTATION=-